MRAGRQPNKRMAKAKISSTRLLDRYVCDHCGARPPRGDYMVHAAVWALSGVSRGFLCLECLDTRLVATGRGPLTLADFTAVPGNAALRFGYKLAQHAAAQKGEKS